jgi:hypothetical protein
VRRCHDPPNGAPSFPGLRDQERGLDNEAGLLSPPRSGSNKPPRSTRGVVDDYTFLSRAKYILSFYNIPKGLLFVKIGGCLKKG